MASPVETAAAVAAPAAVSATTAPSAPDEMKLLRQLEYYFSDVAYPFDEFLQGKADDKNMVPALVLAGSPKIVSMTAGMDADGRATLLLALAPRSDSVVVSECGERIGRIYPLPSADPKAAHSVYISGLPKDADETMLRSILLKLNRSDEFAPLLSFRRLRDTPKDRAYNGQVFVECETAEKASALVSSAGRSGVCTKAKLLSEFFDSQAKSILEQRQKRAAKLAGGGGAAAGGAAGNSGAPASGAPASGAPPTGQGAKRERETVQSGSVLRFEGAGAETTRELVASLCKEHGECAFVEFNMGESGGFVRFRGDADAALAALQASTTELGGAMPTWRKLDQDEEAAYAQRMADQQDRKAQRGGKGRGRGRGRGRRGR